MKKFLTFLLFVAITCTSAQTNAFHLKDENLQGKISKVETNSYTFDKKAGKYVLSSIMESNYNPKGYLTFYEHQSLGDYGSKGSYSYYYNKDDQVIFIDMTFGNEDPERTIYKYEKGKLIEVSSGGKYSSVLKYEYDKNGKLFKEKTIKPNGESSTDIVYEYYKDKDNFKREKIEYYKGEKSAVVLFEIKNGKIILERYISYDKGKAVSDSFYTYKYDQFGNVIEKKLNTNPSPITFDFEFDKNYNITKTHSKEQSIYDTTFRHYFYFTRYIYQDGKTTGSTEFDKDYVKKFDKQN